jgi:O-antigen/teichoic acid export membrane protein
MPDENHKVGLRYKTARAALTSGGSQIVTRILAIVLSVATARALEPREVGILGLAVIVVGVISMLGFYPETAAVAAQEPGSDWEAALAAFVLRTALIACLLIAVLLFGSPLCRYLTGQDHGVRAMQALLRILIWVPVLELISGYPQVVLQRRLDLSFLAGVRSVQPVAFVGLAVILLVEGKGYIGVAWASLIGTALSTILVWARLIERSWFKPDRWPSSTTWREAIRGSTRVFLGGFAGFLGERLDNLLVAGSIGATAMSFYSMAWNASRTPANVFGGTINFVLVPSLARIQGEANRVERALRESLRHSYLLLAPVCAVLFVTAPFVVTMVIGSKWLPLVPCLRVMCFTVLTIPALFAANALLVASGRAHLTGIAMLVHLMILLATIPLLAKRFGILGAAFGDLAAMATSTAVLYVTARLASRQIDWALASTLPIPIIAALTSAALAWVAGAQIAEGFYRFALEVGLVAGGYLLAILTLGGKQRVWDLIDLLRGVLRRAPVSV